MVVRMKSGIEIWVDSEKATKVMEYLQSQKTGFGMVENRLINLVEIEGIFNPVDLEDLKRTKLGQRKCNYGNWHGKDENCECGRNMQPNYSSNVTSTFTDEFWDKRNKYQAERAKENEEKYKPVKFSSNLK
jgi:hypothetical protein